MFSVTKHVRFASLQHWNVEIWNELIQQAIEFGLMAHFERRSKRILHTRDRKNTAKQNEFSTTSISMTELHFLFVLFALGMSISITVFLCEILSKIDIKRFTTYFTNYVYSNEVREPEIASI